MRRPLLALATLTTLTATAAAESDGAPGVTEDAITSAGYVLGAGTIGVERDLQTGVQLEAGRHIAGTHRFIRAQLTVGKSGDVGDYQQVRVGYEHRGCVLAEALCAFGGIDAGYQHDRIDDPVFESGSGAPSSYVVDAHDLLVVPRVGVEAGRHIKARLSLELPFYRRLDTHMDADPSDGGMGLSVSAGVGYAF